MDVVEQDSLREAGDFDQEVSGRSWEIDENRERLIGLLMLVEARAYGASTRPLQVRPG